MEKIEIKKEWSAPELEVMDSDSIQSGNNINFQEGAPTPFSSYGPVS